MSYDPKLSASFDSGEHYARWIATSNTPHAAVYPDDCGPGFEHFKEFHCCYFCGEEEHEANLTRDERGNWRHPDCLDYNNEIEEKLSNNQKYTKRLKS